jgi:tRNA(fMet)-specific endonuclease VapC
LEELENAKEICVDTDILIDFMKGKDPGLRDYERWRHKASIAVTSITVFELLVGARQPNLSNKRYEEARSLIENHSHVYPFDKSAADKASEIGAYLGGLGKGIEIRDLFNASICVSRDVPILTRNKDHYQRVNGLKLVGI